MRYSCPICIRTACLKAEILAEERHHINLEAIDDGTGMHACVDLEAVNDSGLIEESVYDRVCTAYLQDNGISELRVRTTQARTLRKQRSKWQKRCGFRCI